MSSLGQSDLALLARHRIKLTSVGLAVDCTNCGGTATLTICKSDRSGNAGKPVAKHPQCTFYRFFSLLTTSTAIMALIPAGSSPVQSPVLSSTQRTFSATLANSSQPKPKLARKKGEPCTRASCRRARALRCARAKCQTHCLEEGGCLFHQAACSDEPGTVVNPDPIPARIDVPQRAEPEVPPPQAGGDGSGHHECLTALLHSLEAQGLKAPSFPPNYIPSIDDLLRYATEPVRPTSPDLPPEPSSVWSSSPVLSPDPSSPPCSPSPLPPPPSQPRSFRASLSTSSSPPPFSVPQSPLHSRYLSSADVVKPRITSQLDPIWSEDLLVRAKQRAQRDKHASERKALQLADRQKFLLYWYDADDVEVKLEYILDCPCFPLFQLTSNPVLVASLGNDIMKIEIFEEKFMKWIPTALNYTFKLEPDCHVFVRRHGVTRCDGFDEHFKLAQQVSRPQHLRFNMKAERDSLRVKVRQRGTQSDDEVEVVEHPSCRPVKRTLETSPRHRSEGPARARPCLRVNSSPPRQINPVDRYAKSLSRSPSPSISSPTNSISSLPMSTSVAATSSTSLSEPLVVPVICPEWTKTRVWPRDMATCEMVRGFHQMDDRTLLNHYDREALFGLIFQGAKYNRGTYYDNRTKFLNTIPSLLAEHEAAGTSKKGKWASYLAARRVAMGETSKPSGKTSKAS